MKKTAEQMVYNAKNWQWQRTCKEFRTWQKNIAAFARTASMDYFKEILYLEVHSGQRFWQRWLDRKNYQTEMMLWAVFGRQG